ncbi:hypothetical protein EMCRGX_G017328 [Ephydatia muelleri]
MDYATQLRKAFKEAYPEEDVGSAVLLQTFLSGLRPSIARQVMLKGRPTALDKAIEEAVTVEEALRFDGADTMEVPVVQDIPSKGICLRALKTFIYCNPEQEVLDCLYLCDKNFYSAQSQTFIT